MNNCSEYVSSDHPDKVADLIASYLLDEYIKHDPKTRFALEVQLKDHICNLAGEVTSAWQPSHEEIGDHVRDAIRKVGYTAEYAASRGIKVITSTLASSRWKSLDQINEAGEWACAAVDVNRLGVEDFPVMVPPVWWNHNWKKGGLQERRLQIIKEYGFYNQLYCGCEFSMRKD